MDNMTLIMTVIIAITGLVALLQAINHIARSSVYSYGNFMMIDILVIIMYLLTIGVIWLFEVFSGYNSIVIYAALVLVVLIMTAFFMKIYIDHPRSTNRKMLVIFGIYFAVVAYATIFMRIGSVDTSVMTTPFDDIREAFIRRDPEMAMHFILNILMFVPFGYLIPATNPKYLGKWSFSMMGGLIASTVIEGCQLIFQLGQSDVDDIIANTLGAIIGYAIVRFVWQFQKNWRIG